MNKISIKPVIVKSKMLADGSHKIRISVAHNNQTRYIVTGYSVPKENNFKKGQVVGLPNASYINRKIREIIDDLYEKCDSINSEYLSCPELVSLLTEKKIDDSIENIYSMWEDNSSNNVKETSIAVYRGAIKRFVSFIGEGFHMSQLTHNDINRFIHALKDDGLSNDYIYLLMSVVKSVVTYAVKHNIIKYNLDPFIDYTPPRKKIRDTSMTVEELREFISLKTKTASEERTKSFFLLSFYLCGMNTSDIILQNLDGEDVKYRRIKNENRRAAGEYTVFTIPEKAKKILDDDMIKKIRENKNKTYTKSFGVTQNRLLKKINEKYLNHDRLIMYTARKTWAQLAAEVGIQDCVISYCLGDSASAGVVINHYRKVNKEMANHAINRVLDLIDSGLSCEEYRKKKLYIS